MHTVTFIRAALLGSMTLAACTVGQQSDAEERQPQHRPIPEVELVAPSPMSQAERKAIRNLIDDLVNIDRQDYGLSATLSGTSFSPVPGLQETSVMLWADHQIETRASTRALVAMGPRAIPMLLDALEDARETKLVMQHEGHFGGMWFARPVAEREGSKEGELALGDFEEFEGKTLTEYTVKVGDVVYVILGQITGAGYQAVSYVPTAIVMINSPVRDPGIAAVVRERWAVDDPRRALLDLLLREFHATCDWNEETLDGWYLGSMRQCAAAPRLLQYFREETMPLIVARLRGLDVMSRQPLKEWMKREVANDVRASELIKAISWCEDDRIQSAIMDIFEKTDDLDVASACLRPSLFQTARERVLARLEVFISRKPAAEDGPFVPQYELLRRVIWNAPEDAESLLRLYDGHDTRECRRAVIHALSRPRRPLEWGVAVLLPMLDDRRDTGWAYGPDYDRKPIRVCDEAAGALAMNLPGAVFVMEGDHEDLDRQITIIRGIAAGEEPPPPDVPEPIHVPPPRRARQTVDVFDSICGVLPGSSADLLSLLTWERAGDLTGYDVVTIAVSSGKEKRRSALGRWEDFVRQLDGDGAGRLFFQHSRTTGGIEVLESGGSWMSRVIPAPVRLDSRVFPFGHPVVGCRGKWVYESSEDGDIHRVAVETGELEIVWKEGRETPLGGGFTVDLIPIAGRDQLLVEGGMPMDDPLRRWDQASSEMSVIERVPRRHWRGAWGRLAWNRVNSRTEIWDLDARKKLRLPAPGDLIEEVTATTDGARVVLGLGNGAIVVFDPDAQEALAHFAPPSPRAKRAGLVISTDGTMVFETLIVNEELGATRVRIMPVGEE